MQPLHWLAIALAVVGVAFVVVGILQQRAARPSEEIVRGFGGPAGTSDVGGADGFDAQSPSAHYPVGRTSRLTGFGLVLVALILVMVASLT
ncbi:hypothetical protein GA707_13085 [Nostocoides sp. F2B08]|uniref:hypothetical protein n=1 Tax=Nostocoides sp. F2B08 TaxID=2653936 RepID=UPI001262EB80|nr:hypothetical protein [Tetrasphaera sp. F2B08]KAB7743542.1 hypothetical protein GA707_13085 [Tetrasphaera sp. F2B08]